jgi:hypothetical protein
MSGEVSLPAGWYADPGGRHWLRYWTGAAWTKHVASGEGQQFTDPLDPALMSTSPVPARPRAAPNTVAQNQPPVQVVVKNRPGCFTVGLACIGGLVILGIIGGIIAAVSNAPYTTTKGGVQSFSANDSHPPQDDVDGASLQCLTDDLGDMQMRGTLTNHSTERSNYMIEADFEDANGVQVDSASTFVNSVDPNQTAQWTIDTFSEPPGDGWKCTVKTVDRLAS